MQRNAIVLSTIVVFVVAGCNNMGGPPRRIASSQPVPSARAKATQPDLQNSYAVENGKQLRSNLDASTYQAETPALLQVAEAQKNNATIPVVPASEQTGAPKTTANAQHICDENCGHNKYGTVGPDGVLGLPEFRLSELSDEDKQEVARLNSIAEQAQFQEPANETAPEAAMAQINVTPTAPPVEVPVTIPVAKPITIQSASKQENPAASSRNTQLATDAAPQQNPATENPLAANNTVRSQASMQIQVLAEEESAASNPATEDSMQQLRLPPIQGDLASSLQQRTNPQPVEPEVVEPEVIIPPPTVPQVVKTKPEVVPSPVKQTQQPETASAPAGKPASSAGIRVDPSMQNPWATPPASQPKTAPAITQPILRIPAQQPFTTPPASSSPSSKQNPSASDLLVQPASHQEPVANAALREPPKAAPCDDCNTGACAKSECQADGKCVCTGTGKPLATGMIAGMPWFMPPGQAKSDNGGSTGRFTTPSTQQIFTPKSATQNEARVRTEMGPPGSAAKQLPPSGLRVPVADLTTEIIGFGQYERLTAKQFQPGQTILLYCELAGYSSVEKSTRGGAEFATMLESQLVVTDASGKTVQQDSFPTLNDVSGSPRKDFYMYVPFKVGKLPAGNYQVLLRVRDANNNSSAIAGPIDFTVR